MSAKEIRSNVFKRAHLIKKSRFCPYSNWSQCLIRAWELIKMEMDTEQIEIRDIKTFGLYSHLPRNEETIFIVKKVAGNFGYSLNRL